MNRRILALAGAAIIVAGLFTPILSAPIVGSVSIFGNGSNWVAYILLVLAGLAGFLAFQERTGEAIWPGVGAAALLVWLFGRLQWELSSMRNQVKADLADNPFAGLATGMVNSIQIQWGWLVLGIGAGLIIYAALIEKKNVGNSPFAFEDGAEKSFALISGLVAVAGLVLSAMGSSAIGGNRSASSSKVNYPTDSMAIEGSEVTSVSSAEVAAKKRYITENVEVYDLSARYTDSMLDGRVPGVNFKVKNNGERSLDRVEVTVVFFDAEGNAIAEDVFNPVLAGGFRDEPPLRAGYIWQQERGRFYAAKSVPDEWESGKASASITDIEFSEVN